MVHDHLKTGVIVFHLDSPPLQVVLFVSMKVQILQHMSPQRVVLTEFVGHRKNLLSLVLNSVASKWKKLKAWRKHNHT